MAKITRIKSVKGNGFRIDYYDTNGERHRVRVYTDRKNAERLAAEIEYKKTRVYSGLEREEKKNLTISEAVEYTIERSHKKENTIRREQLVFNSLINFLENVPIRGITIRDMSRYFKNRIEYGNVSTETVGLEFRTLRAFFNILVSHEFVEKNPMKGLIPPPKKEIKIRFLTTVEIKKLLHEIYLDNNQDYHDLVQVYLHTGARREELLKDRLIWDNVDFASKRIKIIGKRDKVRYVPMDQTVFEILYRRKYEHKLDFPFSMTYSYTLKRIKKYYDSAGIQNANIHTLRRTFGSLLVQQGVSIFTVSKLLGHSSVTITEKHYADLVDENLRDGINVLEAILI
jgi:site-specific recombinase XerD